MPYEFEADKESKREKFRRGEKQKCTRCHQVKEIALVAMGGAIDDDYICGDCL